jgi:regulator of RNase E activity RraB
MTQISKQIEAIKNQHYQEIALIISELLDDGSSADAMYEIEHHFCGLNSEKLEQAAAAMFLLGYEIDELESVELEDGTPLYGFDAVIQSLLSEEKIKFQIDQLVDISEKHHVEYEGWGTYFEDGEDDDEAFDNEEEVHA